MKEMTTIERARRASGMTLEAVASVWGVTVPTVADRMRNPELMTFGQLEAIASEMDADSRRLAAMTVDEVERAVGEGCPIRELAIGDYFKAVHSAGSRAGELDALVGRLEG